MPSDNPPSPLPWWIPTAEGQERAVCPGEHRPLCTDRSTCRDGGESWDVMWDCAAWCRGSGGLWEQKRGERVGNEDVVKALEDAALVGASSHTAHRAEPCANKRGWRPVGPTPSHPNPQQSKINRGFLRASLWAPLARGILHSREGLNSTATSGQPLQILWASDHPISTGDLPVVGWEFAISCR